MNIIIASPGGVQHSKQAPEHCSLLKQQNIAMHGFVGEIVKVHLQDYMLGIEASTRPQVCVHYLDNHFRIWQLS